MVDDVRVTIGPVPAAAVIAWTVNTRTIVAAVRRHREKVPFAVPLDVLEEFDVLLDDWERVARATDPFRWEGEEDVGRIKALVQYWVNINALSDAEAARLGIHWSAPEAAPFFDALVEGVIEALAAVEETERYARNVKQTLRPDQP